MEETLTVWHCNLARMNGHNYKAMFNIQTATRDKVILTPLFQTNYVFN